MAVQYPACGTISKLVRHHAIDSQIEDPCTGARILYCGEFQRELIVAVQYRNVIAEIAVIVWRPQQ